MKKLFLIIAVSVVFIGNTKAQYYYDRSKNPEKAPNQPKQPRTQSSSSGSYSKFFFASWDGNKPMSNASFINQSSSEGFKLGYRKRINDEDKLWVGFDLAEAVYNQYIPYQTYNFGTQSVSTDLYHYAYNYSATINIDYLFFSMEKLFVPYAGLGLGASYIKFSEYYNIYGTSVDSWGFLVRPEVGILIGFKPNSPWRLKAAVHYDYASNSYNFYNNGSFIASTNYNNFINAGYQIGIVKMLRSRY
jgi:hypothetical protein